MLFVVVVVSCLFVVLFVVLFVCLFCFVLFCLFVCFYLDMKVVPDNLSFYQFHFASSRLLL